MKPHVRLVEPPKEGKMKAGQTVGGNTPGRLLFLDFDGVINSERYIRSTNKNRSRAAAILSCGCTSPVNLAI